jgi:PPM family protein phosphatase
MSDKPTRDTLEMPTLVNVNYLPPGALASLVNVETAALSDRGRVRPNNEDHFLVARFDRTMRTLLSNVSQDAVPEKCTESAYGMLVADGMGGHSGGEVASEMAIVTIVDMVLRTPDWIMRLDEERIREVQKRMEKRLEGVKEAVDDRAAQEPGLAGMGTTVTLAASLGMDAIIAHVGDSRAYLLRQGELSQVTHDHTVAQALADLGAIGPEQAATHRLRHVLTNVIGGKDEKLRVDLHHLTLHDGDQLLLCTDGLSDMVKDEEIAAVLRDSANAAKACCDLIGLALDAGGKDNVTVALARYRLPERDISSHS